MAVTEPLPNSVEIYTGCIAKFTQYFKRSLDQLAPKHRNQLFLVQRKKAAVLISPIPMVAL